MTGESLLRMIKTDYDAIRLANGKIVTADIRRISNAYYQKAKSLPKKQIFELCEYLLDREYTIIPLDWAWRIEKRYTIGDFNRFQRWLKVYVDEWGVCDHLCVHPLGTFIYHFPEVITPTRKWAYSKNRWHRRASAVCLIPRIRKGEGLSDVFARADILLEDSDDMVQKGYGWMLKEAANRYQREVFEYVMRKKRNMPRTSLRYAVEKMPQSLRKRAMARDW